MLVDLQETSADAPSMRITLNSESCSLRKEYIAPVVLRKVEILLTVFIYIKVSCL